MPEGDAVRRSARRLDAALAGGVLERAELRVPAFATIDLRGMTVQGTHAVGKHLLTRLVDESRAWTLHTHLRLDGAWRTGPVGPPGAPSHLIRVWLATEARQAVGVRVHDVAVAPTAQEHLWVGHLGPDVLDDRFDPEAAAARLGLDHRGLVGALLDQRLVSGLGTMWASELAATIGRDPYTPVAVVEQDLLAAGLTRIRRRMLRAMGAPTWQQRRELLVFERTGEPCRTCGAPIRRGRVGQPPMDRPTYWCPSCQTR